MNYRQLISELRNNPAKRESILSYEKHVELIGTKPLIQERWYLELVKPFQPLHADILVPIELQTDFDWDLLMQLSAASFSSEVLFEQQNGDIHLVLKVQSGDQTVIKKLDELWSFQVLRLFEIFIDEQINLCTLCHENTEERDAIFKHKNKILKRWDYRRQEVLEKVHNLR